MFDFTEVELITDSVVLQEKENPEKRFENKNVLFKPFCGIFPEKYFLF
jgi:hypothetical protein